jgi:hypothetical protein
MAAPVGWHTHQYEEERGRSANERTIAWIRNSDWPTGARNRRRPGGPKTRSAPTSCDQEDINQSKSRDMDRLAQASARRRPAQEPAELYACLKPYGPPQPFLL